MAADLPLFAIAANASKESQKQNFIIKTQLNDLRFQFHDRNEKQDHPHIIMRFHVSHKVAVFFTGITAMLFMASETTNFETTRLASDSDYIPQVNRSNSVPNYSQFATSPENTSTQSSTASVQKSGSFGPNENNNEKCDTLKSSREMQFLPEILTPEIITHADPIQYLFEKLLPMPGLEYTMMLTELRKFLDKEQLSRCYIPYAKALSSLSGCWYYLESVKMCINRIQNEGSLNQAGFSFLPHRIPSSPELLQFFSPDIFSDPQPPRRFFGKLLALPDDSVQNMRVQLRNFVNERANSRTILSRTWDIRYVEKIYEIIRFSAKFDEMKRDMAKIQRTSMSEKRSAES